jgi:hypothetical protein
VSVSGRTSIEMARDTSVVLARSWGPFAGCCTPACFPCVDDEKMHARGPTGLSGSTLTRAPFKIPW